MSCVDAIGFLASAAVLATFCMHRMILLRIFALASNVLFASYGYLDHLYPVLALHVVLFPVNAVRLLQLLVTQDMGRIDLVTPDGSRCVRSRLRSDARGATKSARGQRQGWSAATQRVQSHHQGITDARLSADAASVVHINPVIQPREDATCAAAQELRGMRN